MGRPEIVINQSIGRGFESRRRGSEMKYQRKDGYVQVYEDGRLEYEHRLIMERLLGRQLEANEVVHHKNEIKNNNEPSNLELKTKAKHAAEHQRERGSGTRRLACGFCTKVFGS